MKIHIEPSIQAQSKTTGRATGEARRKKHKKLSVAKKIRFYRELLALQSSGIDIYTSLDLMGQSQGEKKKAYLDLIQRIQKGVEQGDALADAMRKSGQFTHFEAASIQAAEVSGTLTEVLREILQYYEYSSRIRRMLFGSLSYPLMLLVVAFVIVFFMLNFVVPMFEGIYQQMGRELPGITLFLLAISRFLTENGLWIAVGLLLAGIGGYFAVKNPRVLMVLEKTLIRIPFVGDYYLIALKSRIASMFHFLLQAHVPLNQCLGHLADSTASPYYREQWKQALQLLERGEALHALLAPMKLFKPSEIMLIQLGEETNKLGNTFQHISEQLNAELEYRSSLLNKFLEPFLISLIALFIGIILIALYMPLFNLSFDN